MLNVSVRQRITQAAAPYSGLEVMPRLALASPGSFNPFEVLDLRQLTVAAAGSERDVYLHPADDALLIKTINRARSSELRRKRPWHKRFQREDAHRVFIAETVEYIATTAQQGAHMGNMLMARIFGLVLTSKGLGLVVERIVDAHGNLAPTLKEVVARQGYSPQLRYLVHEFFMALIDAHVIFNDVSASNIVLGFNANGREGLYLVDGYGSKQLFPLYSWSKALNGRRILRKYDTMTKKLMAAGKNRR
ncbi:YrbL family protein [Achromobacter sp. MFA1 R4]|uniref:YrbL family protein n=1 Tax=Achromobacter sp. MFA1 R4 TaxID=1881016 RepID=UPI0009538CD6|nr:YrbL family protein [Achromobacter sp. MFA1 R4]SIT25541.1 PhoP regulatory network protein YrbL [Achromobacter sp. MFA1 R4]